MIVITTKIANRRGKELQLRKGFFDVNRSNESMNDGSSIGSREINPPSFKTE